MTFQLKIGALPCVVSLVSATLTSALASPLLAQDTAGPAEALAELETACQHVEELWPAALCGPVILVNPATRDAVTNQPDANGLFEGDNGVYLGQWPDNMPVANTALAWEGQQWAMVMLPLRGDRFDRLQLLAHESFHRIQPELGHTVADPMAAHLDEMDGRIWLRMELRAYAQALDAAEDDARAAALDALAFRAMRHSLYPEAVEVERQLEAHEGLAEYTGVRFAMDATGEGEGRAANLIRRFEQRPTYVRSLGYGTGPALGLLLDRYQPGWRDDLDPAAIDLGQLLFTALSAPAEVSRPAVLDRARLYGLDAVQDEEQERAEHLAAQRERYREALVEGSVLILNLPERLLLFNPNTVLSLGEHGTVYPGAILMGPWGRLTLHDGAALAPADRTMARVAAPDTLEASSTVEGPGWTLALEEGWHFEAGTRRGETVLVPAPQPD
ncbi:MAG: hypothetical protein JJU26_03465 [Oceanicaulis sp.]|uniref:hypothetical protein n=1 Tax=Glycocaulis sp. TaxID=1969725 RepID=UPI0025C17763|nr:hypothetical protein [Glycocaulis sp.]MCC5980759.1 hypothetical protein [Oceanicaulis sp.]MCH8521003.1 hypothetical protein [Glycocaulis sp.]